MRVRPQRWLVALLCVPTFTLIALIGSRGGSSLAPFAIVGAIVGVFGGALVLVAYSYHDRQYFAVQHLRPQALVIQCRRHPATDDDFNQLLASMGAPYLGEYFAASFDKGELTLWDGGPSPSRVMTVPLGSISEISVGDPYRDLGFFSTSVYFDRVRITVLDGDAVRHIEFGVDEGDSDFANSARLAFLAVELTDALNGVIRTTAAERSQPLIAGPTAWSLRQTGILLLVVGSVLSVVLAALALGLGGAIQYFLLPIAAAVALIGPLIFLLSGVVARRELAAGYTTLHGHHLGRDQRHPGTGALIRRAGEPQLTDDELRAALSRQ